MNKIRIVTLASGAIASSAITSWASDPVTNQAVSSSGIGSSDGQQQQQQARPNIVLFLVDDMGWQDTSVPFWHQPTHYNSVYETPNMERLAASGMLFTQAYASSISSPSRCSLMTGSNSARHKVTNWTLHRNRVTDKHHPDVVPPDWNSNGIAQTDTIPLTYHAKTYVQYLKDSGYYTIHCGKAHWGAIDTPGEDPLHFGFDVNIAGHAAGGPASYMGEQRYGHDSTGNPVSVFAIPGLEAYWDTDTFATEALTQEAIKAVDQAMATGKPFYLNMSHYAIHVPINRDARFFAKYKAKGLSDKEASYAALIEGMDKSLGDIMNHLEAKGILGNTVILFMSDNGGYATGSYWRDEPLYTQNAPLRCGKGSAYEGGIREPMIVSWPGVTSPGSRCQDYVIIEDFFPSILEMAGITSFDDAPQTVDGVSFVPMLQGGGTSATGRSLYWNLPNIWDETGPGIGPSCTIRDGNWKLIYFYATGKKELYNLARDIGEERDLAESKPRKVAELSAKLGEYLRGCNAQRPTFKATGEPCPWPDEI